MDCSPSYYSFGSSKVKVYLLHHLDSANEVVVQHVLELVLLKDGERASAGRSQLPPCALVALDIVLLAITDNDLSTLLWNNMDARQAL